MKLLLGLVLATASFATTTSISNLNYFTGNKMMSFNATAGYQMTDTAAAENTGFGLNLGMNYGIMTNNLLGVDIGYSAIDTDLSGTTTETSGITDVNVKWSNRFVSSTNHNWDATLNFSPKTGDAEFTGMNRSNNFRGTHETGLNLTYTNRMGTNFEGLLGFGGAFNFSGEITETITNTTTDVSDFWTFNTNIGTRYHVNPTFFVGALGTMTHPGNTNNPDFSGTVNAGYNINTKSNVVAMATYLDQKDTTDTTGWNFALNYNMEL